mmetsp:Transcript_70364/g.201594  ORF Transcript_70364/g.201594 Transcript_70364/m.201594 type:complete len:376 (-) Transcript_70364:193-1320(-)
MAAARGSTSGLAGERVRRFAHEQALAPHLQVCRDSGVARLRRPRQAWRHQAQGAGSAAAPPSCGGRTGGSRQWAPHRHLPRLHPRFRRRGALPGVAPAGASDAGMCAELWHHDAGGARYRRRLVARLLRRHTLEGKSAFCLLLVAGSGFCESFAHCLCQLRCGLLGSLRGTRCYRQRSACSGWPRKRCRGRCRSRRLVLRPPAGAELRPPPRRRRACAGGRRRWGRRAAGRHGLRAQADMGPLGRWPRRSCRFLRRPRLRRECSGLEARDAGRQHRAFGALTALAGCPLKGRTPDLDLAVGFGGGGGGSSGRVGRGGGWCRGVVWAWGACRCLRRGACGQALRGVAGRARAGPASAATACGAFGGGGGGASRVGR